MTPADLPQQNWLMRRIFVWTCGLALLALWYVALQAHQNAWPIAAVLALLIFVYVCAASAEQVTQVLASAGVMRAAQAASGAAVAAAGLATQAIEKVEATVSGQGPEA